MESRNQRSMKTRKLVLLALLTAMVAVLAYLGGFIKIGGLASISLTLIPVVVGAILYGPYAGAWLGGVAGAMFFATPDAAFWLGLSIPGTIITVMVKGVLSGLCAGLAYKLLARLNRYVAVVVSAIVCPVVNTGIFLLGMVCFFSDVIAEKWAGGANIFLFLVGLIWINFIIEVGINIVLSPAIVRIVDAVKKKSKK